MSCGLQLRLAEPDEFHFEPEDIDLMLDHNMYHKYRQNNRQGAKRGNVESRHKKQNAHKAPAASQKEATPGVDLVCRRMTLKWEPIFNIVHRYVWCRCVAHLSTPSQLCKEMTFLTLADCPRHNDKGVSRTDYGGLRDNHQDLYFDKFGGYNSFRAMRCLSHPIMRDKLGGDKFLPAVKIDSAFRSLIAYIETKPWECRKAVLDDFLETNTMLRDAGFVLPDDILMQVEVLEQAKREEEAKDEWHTYFQDMDRSDVRGQINWKDVPMMRLAEEVLEGKWSGRPHWAVE